MRRRQWQPTPVLLPGKSHGRRNLVGCSPWGHYESDTTEQLHFHFSVSCIGGGNGNPLQYSCLENPRDGGAWWAAVYGVAKSWTRLKGLSSSSKDAMRWKFIILRLKQNKWKRKTSRTNNRQLKENYRKKKKRKLDVHNVFLSRYRDITSLFLSQ